MQDEADVFGYERSVVVRGVAVAALLVGLLGLCVWAGAIGHDAGANSYANEEDFGPAPESYIGERVTASGTVVSTEPVVIEVTYGVDGVMEVIVENVDEAVEEGQELGAFGTLTEPRTIHAERTDGRDAWERWYMYGVSAVAGLWVLGRTLRHWIVDPSRGGAVPRGAADVEEPRSGTESENFRGENDA